MLIVMSSYITPTLLLRSTSDIWNMYGAHQHSFTYRHFDAQLQLHILNWLLFLVLDSKLALSLLPSTGFFPWLSDPAKFQFIYYSSFLKYAPCCIYLDDQVRPAFQR